jgi:hypothetical protein
MAFWYMEKNMSEQAGFDGHTTHYTCDAGYDAIQVIEDFKLNFLLGNAVKYILRYGKKGNDKDFVNDLKKAIAYIEREIKNRESMEAKKQKKRIDD